MKYKPKNYNPLITNDERETLFKTTKEIEKR